VLSVGQVAQIVVVLVAHLLVHRWVNLVRMAGNRDEIVPAAVQMAVPAVVAGQQAAKTGGWAGKWVAHAAGLLRSGWR
jgi:hypothetical protein